MLYVCMYNAPNSKSSPPTTLPIDRVASRLLFSTAIYTLSCLPLKSNAVSTTRDAPTYDAPGNCPNSLVLAWPVLSGLSNASQSRCFTSCELLELLDTRGAGVLGFQLVSRDFHALRIAFAFSVS
eukprot:COSAG01_NODE_635_length_14662_cov_12.488773_7_plen_125_part_00